MANNPGALPPPYYPAPPVRNGIFPDPNSFMIIPEYDPPLQLAYRIASVADIKPGRIIYIRDAQSRLDERVMLVLKRTTAGFTCIPFCLHQFTASPTDHWQARTTDPIETNARQPRMGQLKVVLRPYGPNVDVQIRDHITVNIGDLWNVENVVTVAVLGFVRPGRFRPIVEAVKYYFCNSLDMAFRELEALQRPVAGSSAYRRRFS